MSLGDWQPLWLGQASRRLCAAMHDVSGQATTGVVFLPPLLHESPRSRRLLAEIACELAGMGIPCLRFDYHGTGDSSGEGVDLDFDSMREDVSLATAALRERTGVRRVVLLAWRASALIVQSWLERGGETDLVVLWEPVTDGAGWLEELVEGDAQERLQRPPPRAGVARITDAADGQLMGFAASPRLRADLDRTRLDEDVMATRKVWAVIRDGGETPPAAYTRVMALPAGTPAFTMSAAMDATLFLTPPVRGLLGELGRGLRQEAMA